MDGDQRLLSTMPLHAITTTYGTDGLRRRLAAEAEALPADATDRVRRALGLAARLHAADTRQQEPYLNHLLRVAIRIMSHYRILDADVICAALLHDAVEDHAAEIALGADQQAAQNQQAEHRPGTDRTPDANQAAAIRALTAEFGARTADLVAAVTNPPYQAGRDKHRQYLEHVAASLARSPWARVIKASDFTDNGVGLIHTSGPRVARLAAKYAPLVPVLRELIARADTPLDPAAKERILRQLDQAAARFAAILDSPDAPPAPDTPSAASAN